jgi:hypothetical protein
MRRAAQHRAVRPKFSLDDFARDACRDAAAMSKPLDLEWWASSLLGQFWERCAVELRDGRVVRAFQMATRFVDAIGRSGEPGAMVALLALDALEPGPLGRHAYKLALNVSGYSVPSWIQQVGHADVVNAVSGQSPDGDVLFIEARRGADDVHTIAAYIDHRLGGAAKHLGLVRPIAELVDADAAIDDVPSFASALEPIEPAEACRRLVDAIEVTDGIIKPWVGDSFAALRALALTRALPLA